MQGSLAVSRGIGDYHLKPWLSTEPETRILKIMPDHEFLILASDGLWDHVKFLRSSIRSSLDHGFWELMEEFFFSGGQSGSGGYRSLLLR